MTPYLDESLQPRRPWFGVVVWASRGLYAIAAIGYFLVGWSGNAAWPAPAIAFVVVALPFVCFPRQVGSYVGWRIGWHLVTNPSPPLIVLLLGWLLLLFPLWNTPLAEWLTER